MEKPCELCEHFDQSWGRAPERGCLRDADVMILPGDRGALCVCGRRDADLERGHGWLLALFLGTCGRGGRFWDPGASPFKPAVV